MVDKNVIKCLRLSGVLLILAGLILPFLGLSITPMATVIYDPNPPSITAKYPDGSPLSPTPLPAGSTITVYACVSDDVDQPQEVTVKVKIAYDSENETLTLTPTVDGAGNYLRHEASWIVPMSNSITFVFNAQDQTGNVFSVDAYATASPSTPEPSPPPPEPQPNPEPEQHPPNLFNIATIMGVILIVASFVLEAHFSPGGKIGS